MTARGLTLSLAGLLFALVCVFWVDQPVMEWLDHVSVLIPLHGVIKILGKGGVHGAVFLLILLAGGWVRRQQWIRVGTLGLIGLIASGLVVRVMKILVGRARPGLHLGTLTFFGPSLAYEYNSFPSGDAAGSFFVAHFLSGWNPRLSPFLYPLAGLVALTRVIDHAHFPSDILMGATIGVAVASYALRRLRRPNLSPVGETSQSGTPT